MRKLLLYTLMFLPLCLCIQACNNSQTPVTKQTKRDTIARTIEYTAKGLAGNFSDQTAVKFDSTGMKVFFVKYPSLLPFKNDLTSFYQKRNFSFAWYDAKGQIEQAGELFARLQNLKSEGITTPIPYIGNLDSLMANGQLAQSQQRIETELLLSGLYFYFAHNVWSGISQKKMDELEWYLPRKKMSYEGLLDSMLKTQDGFASDDNAPVYRQYNLLKSFLKRYQELENGPEWQEIKGSKTPYRLGDSAAAILPIKKRLWLLGDLSGDTTTLVFDTAMQKAVKTFQHRHGMQEDGVVGSTFVRELNVPLQKRVETIMINMERSRWLPMHAEGNYLVVNIPEFKLHSYNGDSLLWDMNVVVGKSVNKTVIFSGQLRYVVFSPYWNVPPSIVKKEVMPGIRRNKNYLAAHHMERYAGGIRQVPGPWNALGQVKFLFPNSYSIYLHDTPSKSLFQESKRAFSHGCIRVAEPKKLAAYLLRDETGWNDQKITEAMNSKTEKYVTLQHTMPVFITYFTAWVDREGKLNFREDIYNRDEQLGSMLISKK